MQFSCLAAKMENTYVISRINGQGREYSLHRLAVKREPSGPDGLSSSHSNSKQLVHKISFKDPYCQSTGGIDCSIPRHVVSLDEKYLRRRLELIHISASKASMGKISVNYRSGIMNILAGGSNPAETKGEATFDSARLVFECPLDDGGGSIAIYPAGHGIVGSVMGNKSMANLLTSPLHRQFGNTDGDVNLRRTNWEDDKAVIRYNFMNSPGGLSNLSSPQRVKEVPVPENHKFGPRSLDRELSSVSTCSDHSSAGSASVSHGMLQSTWRGGSPRFVLCVDGKEEIYVANLSKADSADEKTIDYVYLLHSTKGSQKAPKIRDADSHLVGKIEVSTSFTIGPNNSKIKETEFILYGNNDNHMGGMQTSSHSLGKTKTLSKKVMNVFRTSHSSTQRKMPRFNGSEAILENCSWDSYHDTGNECDELGEVDLSEKHLPPNFELAAIVVKEGIPDNRQREVRGWGLKFLKNTVDSLDALATSECCAKNTSDCSMSMDILVPAGLHGGPRNRHGGPSSLVDRWKCGHCDCGGWDIGCPLTVFNTQPNTEEAFHSMDPKGECNTLDLLIKASEHCAPSLMMVNIHHGLYSIKFESVLSALQSFSIALAFMHTRNPNFRPKYVQELK